MLIIDSGMAHYFKLNHSSKPKAGAASNGGTEHYFKLNHSAIKPKPATHGNCALDLSTYSSIECVRKITA